MGQKRWWWVTPYCPCFKHTNPQKLEIIKTKWENKAGLFRLVAEFMKVLILFDGKQLTCTLDNIVAYPSAVQTIHIGPAQTWHAYHATCKGYNHSRRSIKHLIESYWHGHSCYLPFSFYWDMSQKNSGWVWRIYTLLPIHEIHASWVLHNAEISHSFICFLDVTQPQCSLVLERWACGRQWRIFVMGLQNFFRNCLSAYPLKN